MLSPCRASIAEDPRKVDADATAPPGQNAAVTRWSASPKRWTTPNDVRVCRFLQLFAYHLAVKLGWPEFAQRLSRPAHSSARRPQASGGALALDPFDRFLYVADGAQNGSVSVYRIAADGAIKPKPVPGSPFPAGSFPFSIAADPFGRFVYAANAVSKDVSAYQVLENGTLVTVPGSPFPITGQGNLVTVAVDPSGRFVYVGNFGGASVSSFRIGSNGALTQLAGSPTKIGGEWLQDLVLDPTSGLLYVLQGETGLESFHIDNTTGALELASAVQSAREVFILAVDPLGKFVYAGNSNDIIPGPVSLSGFHVDSQGVLKPVLGSPFFLPVPDGTSPGSIVIVKRSGQAADQ
jgi:6-phosphogluconolactonase